MRKAVGMQAAGAALLAMVVATSAQSQTLMRPVTPVGQFTVEVLHPDLSGVETASGVLYASGSVRLTAGGALLFEVPAAHAAFQPVGGLVPRVTSTAFGNPYIGVLMAVDAASVELGARLPMASKNESAGILALFTDLDRMEAFVPELATFRVLGRYTIMNERNNGRTGISLAAGPVLWLHTGGEYDDRDELLLSYAAHGLYEVQTVRLNAGATGRLILTEDGSFNERTMHQAVAGASFGRGVIRPGLQLAVPLDRDRRDAASWALGVNVSLLLPR